MSEPQGRVRPLLILGLVAALVLMTAAIIVAVATGPNKAPGSLGAAAISSSTPMADEMSGAEIVPASEDDAAPQAAEMDIVGALIDFARNPAAGSLEQVPIAEGVWLGLGDELIVRRTAADLADPSAWRLNRGEFRARMGPFSALEILADWDPASGAPPVRQIVVAIG